MQPQPLKEGSKVEGEQRTCALPEIAGLTDSKDILRFWIYMSKGAFPPSHFCNKLDDKLARKVALVSL
jgi:hypothetical protein